MRALSPRLRLAKADFRQGHSNALKGRTLRTYLDPALETENTV